MAFLSKHGVARHIYIPIIKRAVVDFAVGADWTPAAGDVKISKDGGAAANVTNLPTAIAMGNGAMWDFSLTATEMQAAQIMVTVADAATKAVEDTMFIIETYGNASAEHAVDLSDSVRAGLTALPNATPGAANGVLIAGSNAATTFQGAAAAGATPATPGLTITGGAASTTAGGVAAPAVKATGGAGAATTNGAAEGANFAAGGTTTVSGNDGVKIAGTGNGHGLTAAAAGTGKDLNATSTPLTLAKGTNITGLNDIPATAVVSAGAITTNAGAVVTVTGVTNRVTANTDQVNGAAQTARDLGAQLDVAVSTRLAAASYTAPDNARPANFNALAITAGGAVTVGTNNDKAGYGITSNVKKNQALAKFEFLMTDSTTHAPKAGLGAGVTVTRSIDGGAFAAGTLSAVTEVSNGIYSVDFAAADLNGNVIVLHATAAASDDTIERIVTQP